MSDEIRKGQIEWKLQYRNREEALAAMYRFLHMPGLDNPEVTLFTYDPEENNTEMLSFSRDGSTENGFLPGESAWAGLLDAGTLVSAVCVAGTDPRDARRVSLGYDPEVAQGSVIVICFPSAEKGLNRTERALLEDMQRQAEAH